MEHTKLDTVDGPTGFLITERNSLDVPLFQSFFEIVEAGCFSFCRSGPELQQRELHSDRAHYPVMIDARRTTQQEIYLYNLPRTQKCTDDASPLIKHSQRRPASIDNQNLRARQLHYGRVALADV